MESWIVRRLVVGSIVWLGLFIKLLKIPRGVNGSESRDKKDLSHGIYQHVPMGASLYVKHHMRIGRKDKPTPRFD
jgi:hypothetical protein